MRAEDTEAIGRLLSRLTIPCNGVVLPSGSPEEVALVHVRWPGVATTILTEQQWDLYDPYPGGYDGGIAMTCNTFLCTKDPDVWLANIARSFKYLIVQDLSDAARQAHRHLSPETGDFMRYSVSSHGIIGKTDPGHNVYDFSKSGYGIIDVEPYTIDGGRAHKFVLALNLEDRIK